jgi:hypothetical protein
MMGRWGVLRWLDQLSSKLTCLFVQLAKAKYTSYCVTSLSATMNSNAFGRITAHKKTALRESLKIVRRVIASNPYPAGFTTAELFKLVVKEPPPADFQPLYLPPRPVPPSKGGKQKLPMPLPPRPDHPIKSITCVHFTRAPFLSEALHSVI